MYRNELDERVRSRRDKNPRDHGKAKILGLVIEGTDDHSSHSTPFCFAESLLHRIKKRYFGLDICYGLSCAL